jgi:hypothetical protein
VLKNYRGTLGDLKLYVCINFCLTLYQFIEKFYEHTESKIESYKLVTVQSVKERFEKHYDEKCVISERDLCNWIRKSFPTARFFKGRVSLISKVLLHAKH